MSALDASPRAPAPATLARPFLLLLCALLGLVPASVAAGCGDSGKPGANVNQASASPVASAAAPASAPPALKSMPDLAVDDAGPYLNGKRVKMSDAGASAKLAAIVKELPIDGKPVTLVAEKRAKTPDVAAVIAALGDAGAPSVLVKTAGSRGDMPKEISFVPPSKAASLSPCTVASVVLKDLSTAVWPAKGATGKRHRKGFAGPDLSQTGDSLKRDIEACDSNVAVVSADDSVTWEMTFNLAGAVLASDEKKKIASLVVPREAPTAGRPFTLK